MNTFIRRDPQTTASLVLSIFNSLSTGLPVFQHMHSAYYYYYYFIIILY